MVCIEKIVRYPMTIGTSVGALYDPCLQIIFYISKREIEAPTRSMFNELSQVIRTGVLDQAAAASRGGWSMMALRRKLDFCWSNSVAT